MAVQQSAGSSSGSGPIIGLGIAFLIPFVAFILLLIVSMNLLSSGPNANGAQAAEYTNLSDQKAINLITQFTRHAKSEQYILDNLHILDTLSTTSENIRQLFETDPDFTSHPKKAEALAILDSIDQAIASLKGSATSDKTAARQTANQLLANIRKLEKVFMGDPGQIVAFAKAVVDYNEDGKSGKIPYKLGHNISLNSEGFPTTLDCSAFVSFALYKAGIFPRGGWVTTKGFYTYAERNKSGLSFIKNNPAGIPAEEIRDMLAKGTLLPGDIILHGNDYPGNQIGKSTANHVVMYIGGDNSQSNIVHSSTTPCGKGCTKSGPQYGSLENRLSKNNIRAIIRVNAES